MGGYLFFESRKGANLERERYGADRERVAELRTRLAGDACDRGAAGELVDLLDQAGHGAEAVLVLDAQHESCPPSPAVVERAARLRLDLGRAEEAERSAQELIGLQPRRPVGYSLRARARLAAGDAPAAELDLRQALELDPGHEDAAVALADLLERGGDLCRAADTLDELLARRSGPSAAGNRARSDALRRDGRCPRERIDGGESSVPYENDGDVMVVTVRINDEHEARMILDTGASSVAITRSLANRLSLDTSTASPFYVATASGVTVAYRLQLESVALGGARVERVRAAVVDRMALGEVEGLLGNSFLSRFQVRVDSGAGRVVLSPL